MTSSLPFAHKVIAITGAGSGIGRASALYLAARGASLALSDISPSSLATTAYTITSLHPAIALTTTSLDVRSPTAVSVWVTSIISHFNKLSGAANCAGILGAEGMASITEYDAEMWDRVIGTNLTGTFHCVREELRVLEKGGSIVNLGSVASQMGSRANAAYSASKHGIVGLTKSAAKDVAAEGTRVNVVCPGTIQTEMREGAIRAGRVAAPRALIQRVGGAEEVAALIAFLLGDESKYLTGTEYNIDGGYMA